MKGIRKNNKGLTLVELLITISILGILTAMTGVILVSVNNISAQNEREQDAVSDMELAYKSICVAVESFDRSEYTISVSESELTVHSATDAGFAYTVSFAGRRLTVNGRTVNTQYVTSVTFAYMEGKTFRTTITYLQSDETTKTVTYIKSLHACQMTAATE